MSKYDRLAFNGYETRIVQWQLLTSFRTYPGFKIRERA